MAETSLIKKFLITERSGAMQDARKYAFEVLPGATKNEIKKAVKELYRVDATAVNIVVRKGKLKRFRNAKHRRPEKKIAIVTLKDGEKIDIGR